MDSFIEFKSDVKEIELLESHSGLQTRRISSKLEPSLLDSTVELRRALMDLFSSVSISTQKLTAAYSDLCCYTVVCVCVCMFF